MNKKRELVNYLIEVIQNMEREEGRRITYTEFAKRVDLPIKTVTVFFDIEDTRLPSRRNAEMIAIGLNSNRINQILGYDEIDYKYLELMHTTKKLDPGDQDKILRLIREWKKNPNSFEAVTA